MMRFLDEQHEAMRERTARDASFNMLVHLVYRTLESGEASIQDWRDAVNYGATEYHLRHIGPLLFPRRESDDR
jgi:hypothetical protein